MTTTVHHGVLDAIRGEAHPLRGGPEDFAPLLDRIGAARFVLIGEASHGTHEFYRVRAAITKRLLREHGFRGVAVEADWPDADRVNRWVRGRSMLAAATGARAAGTRAEGQRAGRRAEADPRHIDDADASDAIDALAGFRRFPQWMWRNADVLDFVGWLRAENERRTERGEPAAGFYGLDLYSLHRSIQAVLDYLRTVDPAAARRAQERYACFEHVDGGRRAADGEQADAQAYGYAASLGLTPSCEDAVVRQLVDIRAHAADYARRDGRVAADELFFAEQNARVVRNAESYYRSMFSGRVSSWNLRDRHMVETLVALAEHLDAEARDTRLVVWAHNSHLGDARATQMGRWGELNVGQLVRERYPSAACLIGFTTYEGTVTAASDWDEPAERKRVRPALRGSYEALFHTAGVGDFLLDLAPEREAAEALHERQLERAIGVIYRPETERESHYFEAELPRQFDAVLHYDVTRAVEPLERTAEWERGEAPETYPSAL
ncbi:MAG TPA: erythromycin esterase family protein [Gemmatimonadaceae bacterium]|nr:erythromycin esterase family protein [Gemmatimonadaceae bacterium]